VLCLIHAPGAQDDDSHPLLEAVELAQLEGLGQRLAELDAAVGGGVADQVLPAAACRRRAHIAGSKRGH
jgi:hypothetical protein